MSLMPYGIDKFVFTGKVTCSHLCLLNSHTLIPPPLLKLKIQVGQGGEREFNFVSVCSLLGLDMSGEKNSRPPLKLRQTTCHLVGPRGLWGPARVDFWGLEGATGCLEFSFPFTKKISKLILASKSR